MLETSPTIMIRPPACKRNPNGGSHGTWKYSDDRWKDSGEVQLPIYSMIGTPKDEVWKIHSAWETIILEGGESTQLRKDILIWTRDKEFDLSSSTSIIMDNYGKLLYN